MYALEENPRCFWCGGGGLAPEVPSGERGEMLGSRRKASAQGRNHKPGRLRCATNEARAAKDSCGRGPLQGSPRQAAYPPSNLAIQSSTVRAPNGTRSLFILPLCVEGKAVPARPQAPITTSRAFRFRLADVRVRPPWPQSGPISGAAAPGESAAGTAVAGPLGPRPARPGHCTAPLPIRGTPAARAGRPGRPQVNCRSGRRSQAAGGACQDILMEPGAERTDQATVPAAILAPPPV
ncbi:hypothetical protein NDU88_004715 [Pleurodeles waltl]|uniref:Uncharacterized protein n=1 Tax=Pleurodeles waltl TaxID=8319 RepID=A0AAV7W9B7_PLEWA|nr:hypothetical protein NDU88_004715 [Pleurodeles waltl]